MLYYGGYKDFDEFITNVFSKVKIDQNQANDKCRIVSIAALTTINGMEIYR